MACTDDRILQYIDLTAPKVAAGKNRKNFFPQLQQTKTWSTLKSRRPWNSRRLLSSASLSAGVGPSKTRLKAATEVSAQNGLLTMPGLDPALWVEEDDWLSFRKNW